MPSPFPGMDPYLEGSLWTTVHFSFSAEIVRQLAPKLRPRYLVLPAERYVMEIPDGIAITETSLYPDVSVATTIAETSSCYETAIAPAPLRFATVRPTSVPHITLEIRDVAQRQLVTTIEVLSPTNKRGNGYEEYLTKRQRILLSQTHLLEIDLLRRGQRVPLQRALPPNPYFICLSRAENRPITEIWPLDLKQPLPVIPIPLLAYDDDIALDLQHAFDIMYDLLNYDLAVDYAQPPEITLDSKSTAWVDDLLQTANLQP